MTHLKKRGIDFPFGSSLMSDFFSGDRFFGRDILTTEKVPAVNIEETEKAYLIDMAVPGMKREDFKVTMDHGLLTISAEKELEKEEEKKQFTRKEFSYESFSRTFSMPDHVTPEKIEATYAEGMLKLVIPKAELAIKKAKEIEIK